MYTFSMEGTENVLSVCSTHFICLVGLCKSYVLMQL